MDEKAVELQPALQPQPVSDAAAATESQAHGGKVPDSQGEPEVEALPDDSLPVGRVTSLTISGARHGVEVSSAVAVLVQLKDMGHFASLLRFFGLWSPHQSGGWHTLICASIGFLHGLGFALLSFLRECKVVSLK